MNPPAQCLEALRGAAGALGITALEIAGVGHCLPSLLGCLAESSRLSMPLAWRLAPASRSTLLQLRNIPYVFKHL